MGRVALGASGPHAQSAAAIGTTATRPFHGDDAIGRDDHVAALERTFEPHAVVIEHRRMAWASAGAGGVVVTGPRAVASGADAPWWPGTERGRSRVLRGWARADTALGVARRQGRAGPTRAHGSGETAPVSGMSGPTTPEINDVGAIGLLACASVCLAIARRWKASGSRAGG